MRTTIDSEGLTARRVTGSGAGEGAGPLLSTVIARRMDGVNVDFKTAGGWNRQRAAALRRYAALAWAYLDALAAEQGEGRRGVRALEGGAKVILLERRAA